MLVHSPPSAVMTDERETPDGQSPGSTSRPSEKRRPGRPPTYVFSKPDSELSENERRLKGSVIKRRLRQNRSYHRKKRLKELAEQAARSAQSNAPSSASTSSVGLPSAGLPPASLPLASLPFATHPLPHYPVPLPTLSALPVLPSSAGMPSNPSSVSGNVADAALPFLAGAVSRGVDASGGMSRPRVGMAASCPPVSSAEMTAPLDLTNSPEKLVSSAYFSPIPRFDGSMIQGPTSNVEVRVENSGGIPFLSIGTPKSNTSRGKKGSGTDSDDKDEAQLLEEILDVSNQRPGDGVVTVARSAGVRPFLSQDIDIRLASLPKSAVDGLKHLVLFPGSFNADSALRVMGLSPESGPSMAANILQRLVEVRLMCELPSGRYELNDITKSLVSSGSFADAREARQRFVSHFISKLRVLDPHSLSRKGDTRLSAMKTYDVERKNMSVALQMCRDIGGNQLIIDFLTQGATVMRYSTSAYDRTEIFGNVLKEIEMSSHGRPADLEAESRMRLALGEAFFDLLDFNKAEVHLRSAIAMMAGAESGCLPVASSVLALLLLAELRISDREFDEAKKLLIQALKSLNEADLQKSTFAVCCLLSLASVYISMRQYDGALHSVNAALEVLTDLGFSHMPIYADALGTLGIVHFHKGNSEQGQTLFFSALKIIQDWMSGKDWESAPFQHCTHLDIFLVESIAQTYIAQDRHQEAAQLLARARQQRQERRLTAVEPANVVEPRQEGTRYSRIYTRHLY